MRSVTPFRVVGLKTTGDCWHCWKATRSTIYFFAFIFLLPSLSLSFLLTLFSFLLSSSLADRMLFQFFQVLVSNTRVFFLRFVRGIDECGGRIIKKQYASFESVVNFLSFWEIRDTVLRIVNRGRGMEGRMENKIYTWMKFITLEHVALCISDEVGHDSFERYLRCPFLSFQVR